VSKPAAKKRLIVGISGASGAIYGIRLLEMLRELGDIHVHLTMSTTAKLNIRLETEWSVSKVEALADEVHDARDLAANISSGSYRTLGMVVAPCSIRTLAAIATSNSDTLLTRAADVALKERRRVVLMLRETPLHTGHCKLLYEVSQIGAIVAPPVPAFYARPATLDDIVTHSCGRVLDLFDLDCRGLRRWAGAQQAAREAREPPGRS
jgi:4-hydroxy-3-polyprenylbenzoate decarboxylase